MSVLTTNRVDAPARHRDLRTAIAWSHDLLPEREQAVFRRLSVLRRRSGRSRTPRRSAPTPRRPRRGRVAAGQEPGAPGRRRRSTARPGSRCSMSLREYAAERLDEQDEEEAATRDRHAAWFADAPAALGGHPRHRRRDRDLAAAELTSAPTGRAPWRIARAARIPTPSDVLWLADDARLGRLPARAAGGGRGRRWTCWPSVAPTTSGPTPRPGPRRRLAAGRRRLRPRRPGAAAALLGPFRVGTRASDARRARGGARLPRPRGPRARAARRGRARSTRPRAGRPGGWATDAGTAWAGHDLALLALDEDRDDEAEPLLTESLRALRVDSTTTGQSPSAPACSASAVVRSGRPRRRRAAELLGRALRLHERSATGAGPRSASRWWPRWPWPEAPPRPRRGCVGAAAPAGSEVAGQPADRGRGSAPGRPRPPRWSASLGTSAAEHERHAGRTMPRRGGLELAERLTRRPTTRAAAAVD